MNKISNVNGKCTFQCAVIEHRSSEVRGCLQNPSFPFLVFWKDTKWQKPFKNRFLKKEPLKRKCHPWERTNYFQGKNVLSSPFFLLSFSFLLLLQKKKHCAPLIPLEKKPCKRLPSPVLVQSSLVMRTSSHRTD